MQPEQQENVNTNVTADISGQEVRVAMPHRGHPTPAPFAPVKTSPRRAIVELPEPQQERKHVQMDPVEPQQRPMHPQRTHTREPFVV